MSSSGGQSAGTVSGTSNIATVTTGNVPVVVPLINDSSNYRNLLSVRSLTDANTGSNFAGSVNLVTRDGVLWDLPRTPFVFKTISTVAVGAEVTIWTPAAGKKFRLMGFVLALSAATTLTLKDNTAGTTIFRLLLGAGGPGITQRIDNGILSVVANNVLTATSGAAANLDGTVWGTEE